MAQQVEGLWREPRSAGRGDDGRRSRPGPGEALVQVQAAACATPTCITGRGRNQRDFPFLL